MIEPMTHVAIMAKAADKTALLAWLYGERGFHVRPIDESGEEWTGRFAELPDDTQELDARLNRIHSVVSFCQEHCGDKPDFIDSMFHLKVVGTGGEIAAAVKNVSIDDLYAESGRIRAAIEASNEELARLRIQKAAVEQFAFLGEDLPRLRKVGHVAFQVVSALGQGGKAFLRDARIGGAISAHELFSDHTHTYYALVAAGSDAGTLRSLIDDHGLLVQPLPETDKGAAEELGDLDKRIGEASALLDRRRNEANRFADKWLREAGLAAGHWESEKHLAAARLGMSESDHLFVTRGYIKTENSPAFAKRLETALPGAAIMETPAPEGEDPPTSMKWNKWISPASLLVKMYGLPAYNSIDPTPYVASIFFLFVGICLGDAVYGAALILIMFWLKRKYREQRGLQDFFNVFVYCGLAAVVVGFLTGSFLGDLSSMIPGLEWFDRFRNAVALIDPIKDSQLALYIAIGIGVFTQIYGMAIRVYRDWRRGDTAGAFSDGLLWIAFLVFALLAGFTSGGWRSFFLAAFILAVIGLVMTQGRDQQSIPGKFFVGLISLYGIVGAYGASAILGDLVSYARLMALALTGAALGSTFNMLARLAGNIAVVGIVIAALVVVFGHLMNFFLALLGAFVHSARLIMLEFFGRFYEAGGYAYRPYGFQSETVDVKRETE